MDRKTVIAVAVTAVIFGAAGFGGGALLGRATAATRLFGGNAGWQAMRDGRTGQNAARGGMTVGKVTEKGADSFTVKTLDGSTRTVYVSGSTQYSKTTSATIADVSVDTTVSAFGTATSAGDITAQRVQIGGDFGIGLRGMFGGNRNGQSGRSGNQGDRMMGPDGAPAGPPPGF